MSKSYTDALKKVTISKLTALTVPASKLDSEADFPLGSLFMGFSPLEHFNEQERSMIARAIALHDNYMSAACDYASDYCDAMPSYTYYLGVVSFHIDLNGSGRPSITSIPLLIAPEFEAHVSYKDGTDSSSIAGVRGLFCRHAIIVKAGRDVQEFRDTLRHEMGHAFIHMMSHLKDEMYGDNDQIQMEEICMHVLSDHFDKLCSLNTFNYSVTTSTSSLSKSRLRDQGWDDQYVSSVAISVHNLSSLTMLSTSMVDDNKSVQLSNSDKRAEINTVQSAINYYNRYFNASGIGHSPVRADKAHNEYRSGKKRR